MICNHLYNVLKMVYCVRTTEKKSLTTYTQKNYVCKLKVSVHVSIFSITKHDRSLTNNNRLK